MLLGVLANFLLQTRGDDEEKKMKTKKLLNKVVKLNKTNKVYYQRY